MRKILLMLVMLSAYTNVMAGKLMSKEESESILRQTISNTPGCIVMDELASFPITIEQETRSKRKALQSLMAFVDAGLLSAEKKQTEVNKQIAFGMNQKVRVSAFVFSMTDKGKIFFRNDAIQISKGRNEPKKGTGFCYADKLEVTGIKRFLGPTIIDYYIQAVDRAEWANNKKIIRAGMIVDKSSMNIKTFVLKGQAAPPPGLKVQAKFRKQKDGKYLLTHY